MDDDAIKKITISSIPVLTCSERLSLEQGAASIEDLSRFTQRDIEHLVGRHLPYVYNSERIMESGEYVHQYLQYSGTMVHHIYDEGYPPALREIYNPPYLLFRRGDFPDPKVPAAGVFGSISPTAGSARAAEEFGRELYHARIPFIWDCRRGISMNVLKGNIGNSLGVCSGGEGFTESVLPDMGVSLVCEHPPSDMYHPKPGESIRIVIGMIRTLCFFEAPWDRMTHDAAECALSEGRDVCVHESGSGSAGVKRLAEEGAVVLSSIHGLLNLWD